MKQLKYYMTMLAALLTFGSCSDDDSPADETGIGTQISLSTNTLQVGKDGGTVSVTVTSDADWRLAGVCDWAHPSATEGKSGAEVTFTIDENVSEEALSTTFKFFTGSAVAPLVIESIPDYTLSLSTEETMNIEKESGKVTIKVITNITDLSITSSENWLTLSRQNDFLGERIIQFDATENETYLERSAIITISNPLVEETINVNLTQAPSEMFEITQDEMEDNDIIYDLSERTVEFKVVTNLEYETEVTEGQEWISGPQISEPETSDNGLSTYTVTYTLEESSVNRVGKIDFRTDEITQNISIIQKDPSTELINIPDDFFATVLMDFGWISQAGNAYFILEKGLNATVFEYYNSGWNNRIDDLTGIENFPNLEKIGYSCDIYTKEVDISGLHKVKEFNAQYGTAISVFNFGDNPITTYKLGNGISYSSAYSITFISEKLENLDLTLERPSSWYTYIETIDLSACPSIRTVEASKCSDVLKTIIMPKSLEGNPDVIVNKPESVTIEYK